MWSLYFPTDGSSSADALFCHHDDGRTTVVRGVFSLYLHRAEYERRPASKEPRCFDVDVYKFVLCNTRYKDDKDISVNEMFYSWRSLFVHIRFV